MICNCTVSLFSIIIPIHSMKYSIHIQKKFICKNCYLKVAFVVQRTSSFIILSKFKLFKFMELKNLEIQNKYRGWKKGLFMIKKQWVWVKGLILFNCTHLTHFSEEKLIFLPDCTIHTGCIYVAMRSFLKMCLACNKQLSGIKLSN